MDRLDGGGAGRVGLLVFTGGVGENQLEIRGGAAAGLGFLGVALDESASAAGERDGNPNRRR